MHEKIMTSISYTFFLPCGLRGTAQIQETRFDYFLLLRYGDMEYCQGNMQLSMPILTAHQYLPSDNVII